MNGFAQASLTEPTLETIYAYYDKVKSKVKGNIKLKYNGTKLSDGKYFINNFGGSDAEKF